MNTDFPTAEIYFVFLSTVYKLKVYEEEEPLARDIIRELGAELSEGPQHNSRDVDTPMLLSFAKAAIPKIVMRNVRNALDDVNI